MSLSRNLARWVEAGLIDAPTAARIAQHEASRHRPIAQYAMGGLGAATLALGLISVVASNWDDIPGSVKLAGDLVLLSAIACGIFYSVEKRHPFAREALVALLYGGALASLGLVGQVYQTGTPLYQALLLWSASTAPLMLLARTRFVGALWLSGLVVTHAASLDALFDWLAPFSELTKVNLGVSLCFASPLLYAAVSQVPWFRSERQEVSHVFEAGAWFAIGAGGFGAQFIWYESISGAETLTWGIGVILFLALVSAAALFKFYTAWPVTARYAAAGLLLGAAVSLGFAAGIPRVGLDFVGALLQIAWLFGVAFALFALGLQRAFQTVTGLIAVRVLVVYFEVFGSLLSTGMGLITGGVLTLLLAWLWRNKSRDLAQHMQTEAGHGV